jgi:hypothetical protein
VPLTGLTPLLRHLDLDAEAGAGMTAPDGENQHNGDYRGPSSSSSPSSSSKVALDARAPLPSSEGMHLACKVILLLVKHRSAHVKVRVHLFSSLLLPPLGSCE